MSFTIVWLRGQSTGIVDINSRFKSCNSCQWWQEGHPAIDALQDIFYRNPAVLQLLFVSTQQKINGSFLINCLEVEEHDVNQHVTDHITKSKKLFLFSSVSCLQQLVIIKQSIQGCQHDVSKSPRPAQAQEVPARQLFSFLSGLTGNFCKKE